MSWYRIYRPTSVEELHLTTVREKLQKLLASGSFPHALLFAGPKGTGKTSAARIIGAVLNDPANAAVVDHLFFGKKKPASLSFQEPNQKEEVVERIQKGSSFVVNEIDAASYRGIDDIRQLKERIFLPPQEGKISVYILDEVHMLTTEAFNALLKMLEEPPPHAVFILATTEPHKIPGTISSRSTVIQFQRANEAEITGALKSILKNEKITAEDAALSAIALAAEGSFRDAVKLLETVAAGQKKITVQDITSYLQQTHQQNITELLDAVVGKDEQQVVAVFEVLRKQAVDPQFFHKSLLQFLHSDLLAGVNGTNEPHFSSKISHYLLTQFSNVGSDTMPSIPFLQLELKALELVFKAKEKNGSGSNPSSASQPKKEIEKKKTSLTLEAKRSVEVVPEISDPVILATENWIHGAQLIEKWEDFLQRVRLKNSSIEALLRSAKPVAGEDGKAKIEVYYQFHRDQLQQPKFLQMLEECVEAVTGGKLLFEFILAEHAREGAILSNISGKVEEDDHLIQLAKEILV